MIFVKFDILIDVRLWNVIFWIYRGKVVENYENRVTICVSFICTRFDYSVVIILLGLFDNSIIFSSHVLMYLGIKVLSLYYLE